VTTGVDLTGLQDQGGHNIIGTTSIIDCAVVEYDETGNVTFEWLMSKHFDPKQVTTYVDSKAPPYDVFHINSVDIDQSNGYYLISARQMDSVFYVENKAPGNVLWKLGGRGTSLDPGTVPVSIAVSSDRFHQQHDARLMKGWQSDCHGGTGQLSLFDDESPPMTSNSRGIIYDVVVGSAGTSGCSGAPPDGGVSGQATRKVTYDGAQQALLGGSVRYYYDTTGTKIVSRVVGWGLAVPSGGSTYPLLTEYDDKANPLLDVQFTSIDSSYRAIKVPISTFSLETLRTNAGQTIP
jgi:hypothetical protein